MLEAALAHAESNSLDRLVVAVPYISVTEQLASVLRAVVDDDGDMVIEHHSALPDQDGGQSEAAIRHRLATENWDSPVVVTTSVRLLESLFANGPTACRRLHRLARSVIVIDESQSIPWRLLDPTTMMLRQLTEDFGSSVVLMTATQPPFERLPALGRSRSTELLDDHRGLFNSFNRVTCEITVGRPGWDDLADEVAARAEGAGGQCLVVLNTIADATDLFERLRSREGSALLTTRLCGAHRRAVLADALARLEHGEPLVLVSTQLIEAGVDIDFPVAMRAVGPLPSLAQVAGRVNRHGLRDGGRLVVFDPADGRLPPGEYKTGTTITRSLLAAGIDPLSLDATTTYFRRFLTDVSDLDPLGIDDLRRSFDYPSVAEKFRLITDETESVLVRYGNFDPDDYPPTDDSRELRRRVASLQPFTVALRRKTLDRARTDGLVLNVTGLPYGLWVGGYDSTTGVLLHDGSAAEVW